MTQPKLRFAPSPTGLLHPGNARTAIINWLFAKSQNARLSLRVDDTDLTRSTKAFEDAIRQDLNWLGIDFDDEVRQSERMHHYDDAARLLRKNGRLYPCFESAEELELKRKIRLSRGHPPIYDREALTLTPEKIQSNIDKGLQPYWRFKLNPQKIIWHDLVRGQITIDPCHISDPVLIRADQRPLYSLSSVVDDGLMQITHVVRGEDHVTNTATQIQIFEALSYPIPRFAHLPLIIDDSGANLSKRSRSFALSDLRAEGFEASAVRAWLAMLGTARTLVGDEKASELIQSFDFANFGRASPRFNLDSLKEASQHYFRNLDFDTIQTRLKTHAKPIPPEIISMIDEHLWQCVRANITNPDELIRWAQIIASYKPRPLSDKPRQIIDICLEEIPSQFDDGFLRIWMKKTIRLFENKHKTKIKPKDFFGALRHALTGLAHGPELGPLLKCIGYDKVLKRLQKASGQ
ncbi:MAG: glutamate--tRNA ligase [Pseudomonadota bacterium]